MEERRRGMKDQRFEGCILYSCDVLINILSRIPAKYLIRFRCVCKLWFSLISDPYFIKTHLERATKESHKQIFLSDGNLFNFHPRMNVLSHDFSIFSETLRFSYMNKSWISKYISETTNKGIKMPHSCNGLVVLYNKCHVHVCNPTTEEFITLPYAGLTKEVSDHFCALGFHQASKKYKVVRLFHRTGYLMQNPGVECEVFTLGSTSWRRVKGVSSIAGFLIWGDLHTSVYLNGTAYWLASRDKHESQVVVSFSAGDEKFSIIPCQESDFFLALAEMAGVLCVAGYKSFHQEQMDSWFLEDYTKHVWVKMYTIDFSPISKGFVFPICVRNGKILLQHFEYSRLYYYDLHSKNYGQLDQWTGLHQNYSAHIESLVPILS